MATEQSRDAGQEMVERIAVARAETALVLERARLAEAEVLLERARADRERERARAARLRIGSGHRRVTLAHRIARIAIGLAVVVVVALTGDFPLLETGLRVLGRGQDSGP